MGSFTTRLSILFSLFVPVFGFFSIISSKQTRDKFFNRNDDAMEPQNEIIVAKIVDFNY
jgi:hypothetical protein